MNVPHTHGWTPIDDLPSDWSERLRNSQTAAMVKAWHEQASELRERDLYKQFLGRLQRRWAIETGVIEGLYTLSEGATTALIEKGLDASLISHEDTKDSPELVIARIEDQHHAIMGLYQFVSGQRPLGTSYIKELHSVLTEHQETYVARDTLGNIVSRKLPRGEWKRLPNNVRHSDGTTFEYCPPEHVASEMDHLIAMYDTHQRGKVPPDIEAAWLHLGFSLIHPFTDGNGRVARCLATLVLLKAHWLPLVVTRRDRDAYIGALRIADAGDLKPLIDLICDLQRKALREALSLSDEVIEEATTLKPILESVRAKFEKRREVISESVQRACTTADSLQHLAAQRLKEVAAEVDLTICGEGADYKAYMYESQRDQPKSKYHYWQIVQCAKALHYFADFGAYQAWAALAIKTEQRTEVLFSFHGIGRQPIGVLGCSAMAYVKERDDETGESLIGEVVPLADAPLEFTYSDDSVEVQHRFRRWLENCIVEGLKYWQKSM